MSHEPCEKYENMFLLNQQSLKKMRKLGFFKSKSSVSQVSNENIFFFQYSAVL